MQHLNSQKRDLIEIHAELMVKNGNSLDNSSSSRERWRFPCTSPIRRRINFRRKSFSCTIEKPVVDGRSCFFTAIKRLLHRQHFFARKLHTPRMRRFFVDETTIEAAFVSTGSATSREEFFSKYLILVYLRNEI